VIFHFEELVKEGPMAKKRRAKRKVGLGLLPKLLLGVLAPVILAFLVIWALIFFSVEFKGFRVTSLKEMGSNSLKELSATTLKESKSSLNKLGEKIIREKAIDVATEMEIYIKAHPKMKREDLIKEPDLKDIAVQKVGETGYTAVHDNKGINYFHVNPQIVGTDLHALADRLPAFWKILEASLHGPASGYYDWKDADGKIRPKYMYLAPVKGTDFIVAATTYIDEFAKPQREIEERIKAIEKQYLVEYENKIRIFYMIIAIALLLVFIVIYYYSRSVIRPILYLSEVADKISMGELDTPIRVKAKGEVRVLAESIERMQTSVKAAIERLQRRRETR
jgi:nitrogen fixation/metabolism regulation signal transduction histidine kinase